MKVVWKHNIQFVTYTDILHEKISDRSLLFSIILFIIDELVKGINIREVVVRMRSSLHVPQQRSHMANASVWVGAPGTGMDFSLDADVFAFTSYGEYDLFYPSEPFIYHNV